MSTVDFPLERAGVTRAESDLRRLTRLLRESALLLEASRASSDRAFRSGSIDLAIRTMRAAGIAIERAGELGIESLRGPVAAVLKGPWTGSASDGLLGGEPETLPVPSL